MAFAADVLVVQGGVVRAVVTSSFCSSFFFDAFGALEDLLRRDLALRFFFCAGRRPSLCYPSSEDKSSATSRRRIVPRFPVFKLDVLCPST